MKNRWSYWREDVFSYSINFKLGGIDFISEVDGLILKLGGKYGFFKLLDAEEFEGIGVDDYLVFKKDSLSNVKAQDVLRCFDWGKWPAFYDRVISKGKLGDIKICELFVYNKLGVPERILFSTKEWEQYITKMPPLYHHGFWLSPFLEEMFHYPLDFRTSGMFYNTWGEKRKNFTISIASIMNIWFEKVISEDTFTANQTTYSNKVLAYYNTPRFNSFLRDLRTAILELDGNCTLSHSGGKCFSQYLTEEGILLDGKIVYQEDIDEGRVKVPLVD